jgi:hypothetical protein
MTLFPKGFDQVIPQVMALFVPYLVLVFPVDTTREGLLFGRRPGPFMKHWWLFVDELRQNK